MKSSIGGPGFRLRGNERIGSGASRHLQPPKKRRGRAGGPAFAYVLRLDAPRQRLEGVSRCVSLRTE